MMKTINKVAISYARKEEREGDGRGEVARFRESLEAARVKVVIDDNTLNPGADILAFMRDIGRSDFLCVFLSEAYMKSPNCMYELLVAWQKSKDHPDEFRDRVKVWVMPGAEGIHRLEKRLEYVRHWHSERERVEPLIREFAAKGLAPESMAEFQRVVDIGMHVDGILAFFANTMSPGSADEFKAWIESFAGKSDESLLEDALEKTCEEVEEILSRSSRCREFLAASCPGLLQASGSAWKLAPDVRQGRFDLSECLKRIKSGLTSADVGPGAWGDLERIIGGVVVLGINREWVVEQRKKLAGGSADYPSTRDDLPIGMGQRANFLHLAVAALAGGCARLERVFGVPVIDERQAPDPAHVLRGVNDDDILTELKLHFIDHVLGADTKLDRSNPAEVARLFKVVKDVMSFALLEERDPYFGSGEAYRKLTSTIRGKLELSDLLLIQPSGSGSEDEILSDPIFVLKHLHGIFQIISSRRARTTP